MKNTDTNNNIIFFGIIAFILILATWTTLTTNSKESKTYCPKGWCKVNENGKELNCIKCLAFDTDVELNMDTLTVKKKTK